MICCIKMLDCTHRKFVFTLLMFLSGTVDLMFGAPETKNSSLACEDGSALLKNLVQNFRRFCSLEVEYTVEKMEDGEWILHERHALTVDLVSGSYKDRIVLRRIEGNNLAYREESWDGKRGVSIDRTVPLSDRLAFSSDITGFGNASIYPTRPERINPILQYFDLAKNRKRIIDELMNDRRALEILQQTREGPVVKVTIGGNQTVTIDRENSTIIERAELAQSPGGEIFERTNISALEFAPQDGWKFPVKLSYRERNAFGVQRLFHRISIVPGSLKINPDLANADYTIRLPVGCKVTDNIGGSIYVVTGLKSTGAEESNSDQLEIMLRESNKSQ